MFDKIAHYCRGTLLCLAAIAIPSGCAGNSVAQLPANDTPLRSGALHANATPHGGTTLTITLPPIQPANVPYVWATPLPARLSPATASVSGTIGARRFGPIALGAGAPACAAASPRTPLTCAITVSAPIGNVKLTLMTYATAGGAAPPLATGTQQIKIFRGANHVTATLAGIAKRIAARLMPDSLTHGRYANVPIVAYGVDNAGKMIPGAIANGGNIDVRLAGFVTARYSVNCYLRDCTPVTCCGPIATFAYDGLATGTETITTYSTIAYNPSKVSVTVKPGNTQVATLLVLASTAYQDRTLQFAAGASGNVPPVRAVVTQRPLFGEDAAGNYWGGTTHYSNTGNVLGTVVLSASNSAFGTDASGHIYAENQRCGFSEYPGGTYGTLKPIRTVNCYGAYSGSPIVDAAGNVYIAFRSSNGTARIAEYAADGGSGTIQPIRTIRTHAGGYATYVSLAFDASGNLYAVLYDGSSSNRLFEFAPGATKGRQLLPGVSIGAIAVDGAGDIYVATLAASGGVDAVEEFPAGSTTPSNVISGAKAMLVDTSQLVVPR